MQINVVCHFTRKKNNRRWLYFESLFNGQATQSQKQMRKGYDFIGFISSLPATPNIAGNWVQNPFAAISRAKLLLLLLWCG